MPVFPPLVIAPAPAVAGAAAPVVVVVAAPPVAGAVVVVVVVAGAVVVAGVVVVVVSVAGAVVSSDFPQPTTNIAKVAAARPAIKTFFIFVSTSPSTACSIRLALLMVV